MPASRNTTVARDPACAPSSDSGRPARTAEPALVADGDGAEEVAFRAAMRRLASGVVVVTCYLEGRPWGITVSACCSISMSPPLLLVSLESSTVSASVIQRSGRFGVSVLGSRALDAAKFAARRGQPKFIDDLCTVRGPDVAAGTPVVRDAAAHVDCVVDQSYPAADHLLFVGRVRTVVLRPTDRPLVYWAQRYHCLDAVDEREQRS